MHYPKGLFQLNLAFADQVARILRQPWPDLLLEYTHTFRRFRLGPVLDSSNPIWQQFLAGVQAAPDRAEYAHQFYLERERAVGRLWPETLFGCFSYQVLPGGDVRLHFFQNDESGLGPLSRARLPERHAELSAMFTHIRGNVQHPKRMLGGSWLYNLPAYRQLFPSLFCENLQVGEYEFPMLSLWGQFLDHRWQVRSELAGPFLKRIKEQNDLEGLKTAFPYPVLNTYAPIQTLYDFYQG